MVQAVEILIALLLRKLYEFRWMHYSIETWSLTQADDYIDKLNEIFATIAALPDIAHEGLKFNPAARIHPHKEHFIIYLTDQDFSYAKKMTRNFTHH
jgi:plasmid stabilization system protein ParE